MNTLKKSKKIKIKKKTSSPCNKTNQTPLQKKKTQLLAEKNIAKNKHAKNKFSNKNFCEQENKTHCENIDEKKKKNPPVREKLPFTETNF